MVPSISETTTLSVLSHTKMRAVQAMAPDAEREKVILFAPDLRFRFFYNLSVINKLYRHARINIRTS